MWKLSKSKTEIIRFTVLMVVILSFAPLAATKYAGEIFQFGKGVRNLALGSTGLTNINSNSLAWWNPALLEYKNENNLEFMHAEEFSGLLQYDSFSAIWGDGRKFGIMLTRIAINDIPLTVLENDSLAASNDNRPYAYDWINNSDLVVNFGFYQKMGKFTIGFAPKIAYRSLAKESGFGFGADLAISSNPLNNLAFAIQVRDFFTTRIFWGNGTDEAVVPGTNLEASYGFIFPVFSLPMRFYLRSEMLFEGREEAATLAIDPLSIDMHAGLETYITSYFHLLMGYNIDHPATGFALDYRNFGLLYSFELEPELDNSHRFALNWSF
jgi:hypothetical protein